MNLGNYNLSWENFETYTSNVFERLYSDDKFTDVTLACDGDKQIKAHKSILSSCSPFFKLILTKHPHPQPLIYLRGISHKTLTSIVKFIYLGQAEVSQEVLKDFLNVAQEFEIEGFSQDMLQQENNLEGTDDTRSKVAIVNSYIRTAEVLNSEAETHTNEDCEDLLGEVKHETLDNETGYNEHNVEANEDKFIPNEITGGTAKKRRSKVVGKKFQCKQCEKQFSDPSPLHRHVKSVHEGVVFKCNSCEKDFKQMFTLDSHVKSKHALKSC